MDNQSTDPTLEINNEDRDEEKQHLLGNSKPVHPYAFSRLSQKNDVDSDKRSTISHRNINPFKTSVPAKIYEQTVEQFRKQDNISLDSPPIHHRTGSSASSNSSTSFDSSSNISTPKSLLPTIRPNIKKKQTIWYSFDSLRFLWVVFYILALVTPRTKSSKKNVAIFILFMFIRLVILSLAVFANALEMWKFDSLAFQRIAETIYIARVTVSYLVMIIYMRKSHFVHLIQEAMEKYPNKLRTMSHGYFAFWLFLVILGSCSSVPIYIQYSQAFSNGTLLSDSEFLSVLIVSSVVYNAIWAISMVILWFVLHLNAIKWSDYVEKLKNGRFESTAEALLEHAKLSEELSSTNANFEIYLFATLCVSIATILSSLYISLLPKYISISIWTISFFFDCAFLMAIFIPGAVVTTYTRRVKKISNKLRALMDPNDEKSIQQLDSFLLYLYTNNASMKVAGVTIDLGFITKLCISLFTISAFITISLIY